MALTPEELRQRIPTWSLESDGHLLQYMISIAKSLEEKCTKTRDNLNSLMLQVDQTQLKLATATNQLSAVEQVKFVENRVEEDDESFYGLRRRRQQQQQQQQHQQVVEGSLEAKMDTDAERSFDDLIQLAVEQSIEGMYKSYEKVTLELTDSDSSDGEEDGPDNARFIDAKMSGGKASVMRAVPRHPFIDRPLPHVIGSKEWQNKWHVGLIDSDDESGSDRKEEYSESSSDTDDGGMFPSQPNSKNHTPSESECSIWGTDGGRKRAPSMDPSVTGDDGSSVYSYASSSKPRTFPAILPVRGVVPLGASLKPPGLFPEEPPEEIDSGKKGTGKGLFDESSDGEHTEQPVPMPIPRQNVPTSDTAVPFFKGTLHQAARRTVNLFDDEPPSPQSTQGRTGVSLFDSDDEQEVIENARNNNNMEENKSSNLRQSGPPTANPRVMSKLVDELNNNFRKPLQPQPVGVRNVDNRAGSNLFDNEPPVDDFEQLFSAANTLVKPTHRSAALPPPSIPPTVEKKTVNLFADDDDDDDDAIVVGSNERQPGPIRSPFISPNHQQLGLPRPDAERRPMNSKKKSIFDESDSDGDQDDDKGSGLFSALKREPTSTMAKAPVVPGEVSVKAAPAHQPKTIRSIFSDSSEADDDDDDDDDALFGRSSSIVKNKLDALKKTGTGSVVSSAPVTRANQSSETSSVKPVQNAVEKNQSVEKTKIQSLFDEDSDDGEGDSLFGKGILSSGTKSLAPQKKEPVKVSLFDDDDDDDGDPSFDHKISPQPTQLDVTVPSKTSSALDAFAPSKNIARTEEDLQREPTPSEAKIETIVVRQPTPMVGHDPLSELIADEPPEAYIAKTKLPADTTIVPEAAVGGSIRSMIMKKSIFSSGSNSDEDDDTIFGTTTKPETAEPQTESFPNGQAILGDAANVERAKNSEAQLLPDVPKRAELVEDYRLNSDFLKVESIPQPTPSHLSTSGDASEDEKIFSTSIIQSQLNAAKENIPSMMEGADSKASGELQPTPTVASSFVDASEGEKLFSTSIIQSQLRIESTPPSMDNEFDKANGAEVIANNQTETEVMAQPSIFGDSSSENETDTDLKSFVDEIKNSDVSSVHRVRTEHRNESAGDEQDVLDGEKHTEESIIEQTKQAELSSKGSDAPKEALESSQLGSNGEGVVEEEVQRIVDDQQIVSMVDEMEIPIDQTQTTAPEDVIPSQPAPLGMIANDIDYFLRTNEPARPVTPPVVKSEPKSALNFSPIGLFDDMPPPDDEDELDVRGHRKDFPPGDASSSLPSIDDAAGYRADETQSLNFIPNGAGAGNSRTPRYLFDDEPPPDEADNSRSDVVGEPYPFRGAPNSKVSLFDDHQRNQDAPVSLPSVMPDTTKAQPRPKVNKLNAKIAINVAALLPGARRPPAVSANMNAGNIMSDKPSETPGPNYYPVVQAEQNNGADKLTGLNKGRARIPTKRKPPSRQTLRASVSVEGQTKEMVDSQEIDDQRRIVVGSEQKMLHIEGPSLTVPTVSAAHSFVGDEKRLDTSTTKPDALVNRLSASVRNPFGRVTARPDGNEETVAEKPIARPSAQTKPISIFGDSSSDSADDDADGGGARLFRSKAPGKVSLQTTSVRPRTGSSTGMSMKGSASIFGSDDDDDEETNELFGGGTKSTIARKSKPVDESGAKTISSSRTITVKPPPTKGSTSLFGDDGSGSDDSDDLFGGKTKTVSKPSGIHPTVRPPTATPATASTVKAATATRTVKDPLADLLDS